MDYRVNFGNGQVSMTLSLKACRRYIIDCNQSKLDPYTGYYFIQRYDGPYDDWVKVRSDIDSEDVQ